MLAGAAKLTGAAQSPDPGMQSEPTKTPAKTGPLPLSEYEPKSMLHVKETRVERARFSAIDIHTHISISKKSANGIELSPERQFLGAPQELLAVMDRKNVQAMVNLTGGYDDGLTEAVSKYDQAYPGRFYTFTE